MLTLTIRNILAMHLQRIRLSKLEPESDRSGVHKAVDAVTANNENDNEIKITTGNQDNTAQAMDSASRC